MHVLVTGSTGNVRQALIARWLRTRPQVRVRALCHHRRRRHVQVGRRPFEMGYRAPTVMMEKLEGKTGDPVIYAGLDEFKQENAGTCIGG